MERIETYWLSETAGVLDVAGIAGIDSQRRIWQLAECCRRYAGVREVVPGMHNLTVDLDPAAPDLERLLDRMRGDWQEAAATSTSPRRVEIPVDYGADDGPDLELVARHTGLSPEEVVRLHSAGEYTVYFLGFLAGFAYLGGLDPRLATPRRADPRRVVPAGSVAIGGAQTGVYPLNSPGGWQLIGRTSLTLFDPGRSAPSLLSPGDTVRFLPRGEVRC